MSDFMDNNGQIVIMFTLLLGSMLTLMICTAILPKPYDMIVGGTLYFVIIIGGFGGGMLYTREKYNQYAHYSALILPSKEQVDMFVLKQDNYIKDGGRNNTAKIYMAFPKNFSETGTTKRVNINYTGDWAKRTHSDRADVTVNGFTIPHTNSDTLILRYCESTRIAIENEELVPIFELVCGSQDVSPIHDLINVPMPTDLDSKNFATNLAKKETTASIAKRLQQALQALRSTQNELLEQTRRATEWQSIAQTLKDTVQQLKAEVRGLLASHSETKERALEMLLPIYNGQGSLAKTIKALRARDRKDQWMLYVTVIAVVSIVTLFFATQPKLLSSIGNAINSPWTIVVVGIICAVAIVAALKFYKPKESPQKGGRRK